MFHLKFFPSFFWMTKTFFIIPFYLFIDLSQIFLFSVFMSWVWASLVAQMVKNLPAMQETQVQSLDQEDPLEKGMATHSSILAWEIPWTEEPGGLQSMGSQKNWTQLSD